MALFWYMISQGFLFFYSKTTLLSHTPIYLSVRRETFEHMKTWLCDIRYNSNTNTVILLVGNKSCFFLLFKTKFKVKTHTNNQTNNSTKQLIWVMTEER